MVVKFNPKIFRPSLRIFRNFCELNFGTIFGQFRLKFQNCSRASRTKFSEMFRVFLDFMESPLSQKFAKTYSFYGAFNV